MPPRRVRRMLTVAYTRPPRGGDRVAPVGASSPRLSRCLRLRNCRSLHLRRCVALCECHSSTDDAQHEHGENEPSHGSASRRERGQHSLPHRPSIVSPIPFECKLSGSRGTPSDGIDVIHRLAPDPHPLMFTRRGLEGVAHGPAAKRLRRTGSSCKRDVSSSYRATRAPFPHGG